jgi:FkbM family methyltransferase
MNKPEKNRNDANMINAIKIRITYGKLLLEGNLSFLLAAFLILPAFMRPNISKIKTFSIFEKPFVTPNGESEVLIAEIRQIIGLNQYHIELMNKEGVAIDAGANIGMFSIFTAVNHPNSTIYAFEPTPSTFKILRENTKHYPNVKIFNYGLGEKEKKSFIVTIAGHSSANHVGDSGIPVDIKTIDGLDLPVTFIKIDAEGYEANILNGATKTIKRHRPVVVMSAYHKPNDKTELPELLNMITPYNCELRHDCEEDLICKPIL